MLIRDSAKCLPFPFSSKFMKLDTISIELCNVLLAAVTGSKPQRAVKAHEQLSLTLNNIISTYWKQNMGHFTTWFFYIVVLMFQEGTPQLSVVLHFCTWVFLEELSQMRIIVRRQVYSHFSTKGPSAAIAACPKCVQQRPALHFLIHAVL